MIKISHHFTTLGHIKNIPYKTSLNSQLRNGKASCFLAGGRRYKKKTFEQPQKIAEELNKEFEKLFPLLFTRIRYRGISNLSENEYNIFKNYKKGDVFTDKGFGYYSKRKEYPFSLADAKKNGVFITLKIPRFSKVSRTHPYTFKYGETMTKSGQEFEVLDKRIDEDGLIYLVIKMLKNNNT